MHLNEDNKEIDVVTLMDQLSSEGTLNEAGGNILQSYLQMYQRREMFSIILISFLSMH